MFFKVLGLVLLVTLSARGQNETTTHHGSTEDLEFVFQGRCWDYDVTKYLGLLPRVETSCSTLWQNFSTAFDYQEPCNVSSEYYDAFFTSAGQELPKDKVMFWSGLFRLSHRYAEAGRRYITLEDTMIGYLANDLNWCGQLPSPGINYARCPEWSACPHEASLSFWAGASMQFASKAKGKVTVMVDGSNPDRPAYRKDSFFAQYEVPSLNKTAVTDVFVIVAHELGKPKIETCGTGSVAQLQKDVEARGFAFSCQDNPLSVLHLLCSDDPTSRECQLVLSHFRGESTTPQQGHGQGRKKRDQNGQWQPRFPRQPTDRFSSMF